MKKIKLIVPLALLALLITAGTVYATQGGVANKRGDCDPGKRAAMMENHEAVMEAVEAGDYQTWSELMAGTPMAEVINEDNFGRFVEMHQLMQQAREIAEELGLDNGFHKRGFMKGVRGAWHGNTTQDNTAN